MDENKGKKKRGRKPNINVKNTKITNKDDIKECFIIKINNNIKDISDFNINSFNENDVVNQEVDFINTSQKCWNCCHDFLDINYGLPLKYINKTFYIYGDFCSFECSLRYGYEYLNNKNIHELYSNIYLYKKKLFNDD